MVRKVVEAEVRPGLTWRSFVTGIAFAAAWNLYMFMIWGTQAPLIGVEVLGSTVLTLFALMALSSALKRRGFTQQELTVVYGMLVSSLFVSSVWVFYPLGSVIWAYMQPPHAELARPLLPPFWLPKDLSLLTPTLLGGAAVPWDAWLLPMTFWALWFLTFIGFLLCFNLILSHRIIEEEMLPFPLTRAVIEIVREPRKPFMQRPNMNITLIGLLVGFIAQSPYGFLHEIIPAIPNIPWKNNAGWIGFDLTSMTSGVLPNGFIFFGIGSLLFMMAIFILTPMDITLTAVLTIVVIYMIVGPIEVKLGMVTDISAWADSYVCYLWTFMGTYFEPTGIQFQTLAHFGFPVGIALCYLVLSARTIGRSFKSAIRGGRTGPFSSRLLWLGFVGLLLVWVALTSMSNIPVQVTLLFALIFVVINYALLRMRGEALGYTWVNGGGTVDLLHVNDDIGLMSLGGEAARNSAPLYCTTYMLGQLTSKSIQGLPAISILALEGFKLGSLTNTRWRDILIPSIIAVIFCTAIGYPLYLYGAYSRGFEVGWKAYWYLHGGHDIPNWAGNVAFIPGAHSTGVAPVRLTELIVGMTIAVVVTVLKFSFAWFPLNPIGLFLGAQIFFGGVWFQALLALVTKYVVLKIGGSRLYEEKLIPLATGFIVGSVLLNFIHGLVVFARGGIV